MALRTPLLVTLGAAAVLATACGSEPDVSSTNRGTGSTTTQTTIENAFIVPTYRAGACAIQVGNDAALRFTVTNNSSTDADRLLDVRSDVADASRLTGDLTIAPSGTVGFGQPSADPGGPNGEAPAVLLLGLRADARPATSHDVVFEFEKQGPVTVRTPIEACPTQQR